VKGRTGYFITALLLTLLNAVVTMYSGVAIWKARPGDIWDSGLLVLLAALGATSLVDVWIQAISGISLGSRTSVRGRSAIPIPAQVRGHGNV
jgi:hypothetical protein